MHLLKRGSDKYKELMCSTVTLPDADAEGDVEFVEAQAGKIVVTNTDALKEFLSHFEKYLKICTLLRVISHSPTANG